jgi:glycosyltransferase involved in cell wall biosynthesis
VKIGLNATCIGNRASGARQRFLGLYREVVRRMPEADFVIYTPADGNLSPWFAGLPNVCMTRTPIPSVGRVRKLIHGLHYWRPTLRAQGFDVFEVFNLPAIKAPTGRTLLTIHDIRELHPQAGMLARTVYAGYLNKALQLADHVITVSQAMKDEILDTFPGKAISVVHNGLAAENFQPPGAADLHSVRQKYALPQQFLLAVGHFEARKNYLRLIDAIAMLRDRGQACPLVIVGNDSGLRHQVTRRIEALGLDSSVIILSNLSDTELRCVYTLCSLFVFPSAYEGFGIPILEAMAAGRPMVLSNLPAFREITENRGVYFPPNNTELMADAIARVLSSGSESDRLVAYGAQRIHSFSYHRLSEQIAQLYRSLS